MNDSYIWRLQFDPQRKNMKNLLPLLSIFWGLNLFAQSTDSLQYDLPDITISANRLEIPFSEYAHSIEVITAQQIQASPVQSVAELLRYVSGVDVRQRGVAGIQADISIRGGTFDQTLVLINGIKMSDPQTGHHLMNLPIDLENVERIEILKGPGARIYGQNAFAGAINIITKTPDESYTRVEINGGQYQSGGLHLSASLPHSNFRQYISFGKDFSQGYRPNTDYDINNAFYQAGFSYINTDLTLTASYTERAFGANGFYASPAFTEQYEEIQTSLVSLQIQHRQGNWTFTPRIYWRRNQDEYIFVRSNPSLYRNLHIGNVLAAEMQARNTNKWGQTGLGTEWRYVQLQSNNLGQRNRHEVAFFAEHQFKWGRLDLTPGVHFQYFTDFGPYFVPGIDIGLEVFDGLRLFANAGQTYRVPTYTDLYYQDPANLGNPDLQPESAFTLEAGIKQHRGGLRWQASFFRRDGRDLIDWTKEADTLAWQPRNFANLNTTGIDASIHLYFPALLGENQPLQRLDLSYTWLQMEVLDNEFEFSRYALENLRHQLIVGLEYKIFGNLFHRIQYRFNDRVTLENYAVIDTRFTWMGDGIQCFLEASNLLDVEYTETNLVPMPGRWIRAGLSFKVRTR
jgi:vitamin B12 transporter